MMSVLEQCNREVAKFWVENIVTKKHRKKILRQILREKNPPKIPPNGAIESLEELIVS